MISQDWIVPTDDVILSNNQMLRFALFLSPSNIKPSKGIYKARVVFYGAATFKGAALNDAVHSGINLSL